MNTEEGRESYNELMDSLLGGILDTYGLSEESENTTNIRLAELGERLLTSESEVHTTFATHHEVEEELPVVVEEEPVVVEEAPVGREIQEPRARQPRATSSRTTDYTLAWDIYNLGYSTGDVAFIYKSSAGSISRGIKKAGHTMRTGAETKAMSKTNPDNFGAELMGRINTLLSIKHDTDEERNTAFYMAFGVNLYEVTMYEAENEQEELENLNVQATTQGVSLADLARQQLAEQPYESRQRSPFVESLRTLHKAVKDMAKVLFGDVNVGVGAVDVQTKLNYENGISLTVKDFYKIDGKALDVSSAVFTVNISDYIASAFSYDIEQLYRRLETITGASFTRNGEPVKVTKLGNRLVVGLENE